MIDAFTRCNVCEMSPAETLYADQPMCYDCRTAYAKAEREESKARANDYVEALQDRWEAYCLARVAPFEGE